MAFEIEFIKWLQRASSSFLDLLAKLITLFGEQYILIVILAYIYFVYNKKTGEKIAYSLFLSLGVNNVVKGIVKAPRPFQVDPNIIGMRQSTATGFSFPSGHTQISSTFYTSITKIFKNKKLWFFTGLLIALVALSRVYLGVHFPKDVIVGILLGVGLAILGSNLYDLFGDNPKTKNYLFIITALILLPFAIIFYKSSFQDILPYRDFYTNYALFLGFIFAIIIENRYVNFDCKNPFKTRIIRYLISLILFITIMLGLKIILPKDNIWFDMLRYFLVSFIPMGIYPLFFKKFKL